MKCPRCGSDQISKNGRNRGKQNYICKQCSRQFLEFYASRGYSKDAKNICLKMYANGTGFRAIERATGISHNTVINWVKQANMSSDTSHAEDNAELNPEDSELCRSKNFVQLTEKTWLNSNKFNSSLDSF